MKTHKGQVAREHTPLTRAIARQVKKQRDEADLSQEEVALRAGMKIGTYRRLERQERAPTFGYVEDLARAFGMPVSALIRRAEDLMEAVAQPDFPVAAEAADVELQLRSENETAAERHKTVNGE